ncbi:MAG: phosphosulfolactate synthase [Bacteroidia bacterium]
MNFNLKSIPNRSSKPREEGLTMVMDKGISLRQVEDFLSMNEHLVDLVKLGFGTSVISKNLKEKIALYKQAGIKTYFGGTLFEAFVIRNQFKDYKSVLEEYELEYVEVSDGSIELEHAEKCDYISDLAQNYTVLSEVGSKDANVIIPPYKWIKLMKAEFEAGSWKVIAEARESGTVGIFRGSGEIRSGLIDEILTEIKAEDIIWEAPQKGQQVWFIKLLGHNVNLGNIGVDEVIPLETLRLGLRGDTFTQFLNQ